MDPDPNGLYTKRKQQRIGIGATSSVTDSSNGDANKPSVKYPSDGWSTSLEKIPMFTRAEMNEHIARSGKSISNIQHHSVPTSLRKAKTFLEDEYLREITAASDDRCFYFQAKCCHSFRKNDPPHQLKLALCIFKGDVLDSSCTCVAGKAGFCNHISALMFKICKYTLFEAKTTKDLCQEKDENPELACTSQLQRWHKKGGGENIVPQPVMEVYVTKTKLDEPSSSRGSGGVKCLLYEARKQPHYDPKNEASFKTELATIDPNMGFAHLKCPHSKFHVTSLEACSDPNFFMEKISDTQCRLKRDHAYYGQVQGQMGVTGAKWCDFIVYTSKGIYIERIAFDPVYWGNLKNELLRYYFEHFLKFASADFHNSA